MSTTQTAATLYHLQQLDLELERLSTEQRAIAGSLQDNAPLHKLRTEQKLALQQSHAALKTQQEAEWALEDLSHRLKTQEHRLYNGTVSNPKELNALQQEVQRLRTQQSLQEEKTLEVMEATESLQQTAQRTSAMLQQAEAAWVNQNAVLISQRDQLEAREQDVQLQREQLAASLQADLISRYDRIRRTRQGKAVSKVEQGSCQWCRVILTPSELQHVRISTKLETCSNCGRFLYFDR